MTSDWGVFLTSLFAIGFLADLSLNTISKTFPQNKKLGLLREYWDGYGALLAGLYAGLITMIFGGLAYGIWRAVGSPHWTILLLITAVIAFVVDIIAGKTGFLGGNLNNWYNNVNMWIAALWASIAIVFASSISYVLSLS